MILTLTPNPSIDLLFEVGRLVWDDANRLAPPRRRPGGQGINVARAVRALGGEAAAVAPLGGVTGQEMRAVLEAEGLPLHVVEIAAETRTFVGVRETETGRALLLNARGPSLDDDDGARMLDALDGAARRHRPAWIAACGSLPPGLDADLYARAGEIARRHGSRFVADGDGPALERAAHAGCDLLVPNRHEAIRLLGAPIDDAAGAARAANALLELGPALVAITLGEEGAVLADATGCWLATPPAVQAGSAVGAGDAFLAGLLLAVDADAPAPDALVAAVAAGTAVLLAGGADLLRREDRDALARRVVVRRVR